MTKQKETNPRPSHPTITKKKFPEKTKKNIEATNKKTNQQNRRISTVLSI